MTLQESYAIFVMIQRQTCYQSFGVTPLFLTK